MKTLITDYVFDKDAKTITFTGKERPDGLEEILIITNVTTHDILYNFADKLRGGTLTDNVLTFDCATTGMSNTDKIQIFIDSQTQQENINRIFLQILKNVTVPRDSGGRVKVIMDNNPMLYTYMRNSSTTLVSGVEGWYSASAWNVVDAREQLMVLANNALINHMQKWS